MKAVVDIGNTTITIGLSVDGSKIDNLYRLNTDKNKSYDEYTITLKGFISSCSEAMISSVVPEINEVFREFFQHHFGVQAKFLGHGVKTGIQINVDNPKEVGGDIISNAVGAVNEYDETCLVVDLGTATTFTYIENNVLKGVSIAPGLSTSKNALISKASLLPQIELVPPKRILGTNSADSIKSGLIFGHASMIDGMVRRVKEFVHKPELKTILTGGHADIIYPLIGEEMVIDQGLILKGLLTLLRKNK